MNAGNILQVIEGSIYSNITGCFVNNPAILIDTDGVLLKYGDVEKVTLYYNHMIEKYTDLGFTEEAQNKRLIVFDQYEGKLSVEEICTVINYGMSCHAESFYNMFSMSPSELKERISELQSFGY